MPDFAQVPSIFLPHGYCFAWQPQLLWTLVISDVLIAMSYFAIPLAIYGFARKQPGFQFPSLLVLFGVFIVACGITHVLEVINIWRPVYNLSAGAKAATAAVSVLTAIAVWPMFRNVSAFLADRALLQQTLEAKNAELEAALKVSEERKASLQRSENAFRSALMGAPVGMATVSLQGGFVMVNKALSDMLGYSASELERMSFQQITHADDLDADLLQVASLIDGLASSYRLEKRYLRKDGGVVHSQLDVVLVRDADGQPHHFIAQIQDIGARKQMENALLESRHRYRTLLDNLPTAVVVHRADTTIEYANPASATMLGLSQDQLLGKTAMDPHWRFVRNDGSDMPLDDYPVMLVATSKAPLRDYVTGVIRGRNQATAWVLVNTFPVMTSQHQVDRIIVCFIDITERRELEQELARQARTDALTGLGNRRQFDDDARREFVRHRRNGKPLSVLCLDLDHFKSINDSFGHEVGDMVLRQFADICRRGLRENDIACRTGGEEFAVLLPDTDAQVAAHVAERIRVEVERARVAAPGASTATLSVSIGVAELTVSDEAVQRLIGRADAALYKAKQRGRNRIERDAGDATASGSSES